jgi:hypothetical protein
MRYRRIAARDRREPRTARTIVGWSQIEGDAMGGDPIERRIAPSGQWGYQYGDARGGGGFSPRGAAETITATLQDGARGDGHAPLRGDTSVTPEQASAAEDAYIARIRALQEAFTSTATIETIGDLVKLAPRLATARTMATLLRRYRDFDAKAVALEGAMEETPTPSGCEGS